MADASDNAPDPRAAKSPDLALWDLGFFTENAAVPLSSDPSLEQAGTFIDRYQLLEPLGEGGFGFVWWAQQIQPFHRELALKLIKPGMDSREIIARFQAERRALALMDHPNIAAVLDAGTTTAGRPYFVMELVKGEPITQYCDRRQLGLQERLRLFIPVCQAVQHAHQKSILHRDLKPSNILVTEVDGKAVPKVIDFGIAKALGSTGLSADGDPASLLCTQMGMVIGTPRYMSPEQAGSMPDVDTRSDVYSLGVILCELLAGRTPFPEAPPLLADAITWIREAEPSRPSLLLQKITPEVAQAAVRRKIDPPSRFARALRGDLDWIILKAVDKDRARRYETATALAGDLQRYLNQEPVGAVAPSWHYPLGKFARRHRGALVSGSLVVIAMVAGTAVSLWQASQAEKSRVKAEESRMEAEANYRRARETVETYLHRVTENPRLREADFQDLQQSLLESALPFYEEISRSSGNDPGLESDHAWAMSRIALIFQLTGNPEKASEHFAKALALGEKLAAKDPASVTGVYFLASRYTTYGVAQELQNKLDESYQSHTKALHHFAILTAKDPSSHEYGYGMGVAFFNRSATLSKLNRNAEALADVQRAVEIQTQMVAKFPAATYSRQQLGSCLVKLGTMLVAEKSFEKAEDAYRRALVLLEEAHKRDPNNRDHRRALAGGIHSLGMSLSYQNRGAEGLSCLQQGLILQQKLVNDFPSMVIYRETLVDRLVILGAELEKQGKEAEALANLQRLLAEQKHLVDQFPRTPEYSQDLAKTLAQLATRARNLGNLEEALTLFRHAVALAPEPKYRQAVEEMDKILTAVPPPKPLPETKAPLKFTFDYPLIDPGVRHWARNGETWTETQPSGKINRFKSIGPIIVDGVPGTEIQRQGTGPLTLFVPDLGTSASPQLMLRDNNGTWVFLGAMENIE